MCSPLHTVRPAAIDLNPYKLHQGLHLYPLMVGSKRCNGSCHTFNDLNGVICVLNKIEDVTILLDSRNK